MLLVTEIFASNVEEEAGSEGGEEAKYIGAGEFGIMVFLSLLFGAITMPLNIMGSFLTGLAISQVRFEARAPRDTSEPCARAVEVFLGA
jgi:hypothetical protein